MLRETSDSPKCLHDTYLCAKQLPPVAAASFAIIAMQILKKKKMQSKQRRRWWCRHLFQQRLQYGNRLMKDMQVELIDDIIKNFTRMTLEDFEYLASLVCPKITRMNTNMREAITARERLALTLRFLATGDSFTSLQYLFRISKSSISGIIPEVCDAISDSLQEYIKVCLQINVFLYLKTNVFK
ncbi:hypothetical protein QTP88_019317 [Uroleucon formosanum]